MDRKQELNKMNTVEYIENKESLLKIGAYCITNLNLEN